jgi:GT2 family glycosyltransferase
MGTASGPVTLGYVHAGEVRAEFMRSVLNVTAGPDALPQIVSVQESTCGSLIGKARNQLVEQFLKSDSEWLWQVDTDTVFNRQALPRLLKAADAVTAPVVSGLVYILREDGKVPSMFTLGQDGGGLFMEPIRSWRQGSVVEADACGAACLLVHRTVYEKIEANQGQAWFLTGANGLIGEDIAFCLRARQVGGWRPRVATNVQCGHVKSVVIGAVS